MKKAVSSTTEPSQEGLRVAELESTPNANKSEIQTLPRFAFENSTLREEDSRLRSFVVTLGCEKRKMVMLQKDFRDLTSRSKRSEVLPEL